MTPDREARTETEPVAVDRRTPVAPAPAGPVALAGVGNSAVDRLLDAGAAPAFAGGSVLGGNAAVARLL